MVRLAFWRKKIPVMWIVEGNQEIPIEYDYGRIPKIIDKAIKLIIRRENRKQKINREMKKLLKKIRDKQFPLIF